MCGGHILTSVSDRLRAHWKYGLNLHVLESARLLL